MYNISQLNHIAESELVKKSIPIFCSRSGDRYFFNISKNRYSPAPCKCYKCPECGKFKRINLQKAIENYISKWNFLRMWTFTYRHSIFKDKGDCYANTSKIWKYFITYLRRSQLLSRVQAKSIYIKVLELHKSGFIHYHVLFSTYLPVHVIRAMWQKAINIVMGSVGWNGNVNISKKPISKSSAGRYIAKYVTKAAQDLTVNLRLWSKSEKVKIFEVHKSSDLIINAKSENLGIILKTKSITSQNVQYLIQKSGITFILSDDLGEVIFEKRLHPPNIKEKMNQATELGLKIELQPYLFITPLRNNKIILESIYH